MPSPFHSHEEEDRREAARLEGGQGRGAAGREDVLRDGVHIPELQASHLHRPMKNERARSAFDGDPTVDISSIDRLNGTFG